jgi:death-on-curing protein
LPSSVTYLSLDEVLAIHDLVLEYGGGTTGVRDLGLVDSAIGRPQTGYYADLVEMAAALMESLLINHPFLDGNKRTAFVATDTFLRANGYRLDLDSEEAFEFIFGNLDRHSLDFAALVPWISESLVAPTR